MKYLEDYFIHRLKIYSNGPNGVNILKYKSTSKFKTWDNKQYSN